jgi:two-component system phosphate regulon response regulator PhoB
MHASRKVIVGLTACRHYHVHMRTPFSTSTAPIVVADDDEDILALASFCLRGKYPVLKARDGEEALELASRRQPALVLLDIKMPRVSGDRVLRELRRNPATANIPVVLFSAHAEKEMVARGVREGADAYIVKPFSPHDLASCIEKLLSETVPAALRQDRRKEPMALAAAPA